MDVHVYIYICGVLPCFDIAVHWWLCCCIPLYVYIILCMYIYVVLPHVDVAVHRWLCHYVYMYIYICVYIYIYIYLYIYTCTQGVLHHFDVAVLRWLCHYVHIHIYLKICVYYTYIYMHVFVVFCPTLTLLSISGFATIHCYTTYIFMYMYIYVYTWRFAHFDVAVHMWLIYICIGIHICIYICVYIHASWEYCISHTWTSHVTHACHFHACCMRVHSKSRLTHVTSHVCIIYECAMTHLDV